MSSEAGRPRRPASRAGALALLALTFPGLFLPLDVIYAGPGISAFATPDQAARIFLYSVGVSLLLSLVACAACGIWWKRGAEAALLFSLTLIAFAILNGVVVWSAYYVAYSSSLLWLRRLLTFGVSVLAAVLLAPQLRAQDHATLRTLLGGSTTIVALGALACAMFLAFHRVPEARAVSDVRGSANRPSIFLITVDTLSALHLPMYGYARDTTPNLADFASHANLFLRNYADSNFTTPSITSILYGVRPWTHRAIQLEARPLRPLASESLPAELQAAGYFTASVATNPWAAPRHLGIEDRFAALSERRICGAANPIYLLPADLQVAIGRSLLGGVVAESVMRTANALGVCPEGHFDPEIALSEARRILAAAPAGKPVFLWIHLYPPHDPYLAPEPFAGTFDSSDTNRTRASTIPPYLFEAGEHFDFPGALPARYDEAVRYVDHHIGGFLDYLKKMNRYDASIIVVSADHGESFTHRYGNHSGPKLHEELIRVPLLIKTPGQTDGRRIRELSEQVDLMPTLLSLADIPTPKHAEGVSLLPAINGHSLDRPVFIMNLQQSRRRGALDTGTVAMVESRWKYVRYFGDIRYPDMPLLGDELYDLAADPWETSNRREARRDIAAKMRRQIEAKLRGHGRPVE